MRKHYFIFLSIALMAAACPSDPSDVDPDHSGLKIVLSDSLDIVNEDDGLRVPEIIRDLCDVFVSESKTCNKVFVLDPSLVRLDQDKDFSLKTIIEKGGAKKTTHPKVISKLIKKHFDEVDVPEAFVKASKPAFRTSEQIQNWLSTKAGRDSVVVLITTEQTAKYTLYKKSYPTFTDVATLREHIQKVLCQNDKANFSVLYNPPSPANEIVVERSKVTEPTSSTVRSQTTITQTRITAGNNHKSRVIRAGTQKSTPDGICDPVTHNLYERVYVNGTPQRGEKVLVMNCKECGYN